MDINGHDSILPFAVMAQQEEDTENGVVSLAGRKGFTIQSKKEILCSSLT